MVLSVDVASTPVENVVLKKASPPIDYHLLLSSFLKKHDVKLLPQLSKMLRSHDGKETKLCLRLAKKYDALNPLNRIFLSRVVDEDYDDYEKLTKLYLSIFYPQDVDEAKALCNKYVGKEDEMFIKLSSNFRAINPLLMDLSGVVKRDDAVVDYKALLTAFYEKHDPEQVVNVNEVLGKCVGKEAILFSVIALKYDTSNALNSVFEEIFTSVVGQTTILDHMSLLRLYLSVFHPSCTDATVMLEQYQGKESELFSRLATKFRACNPLDVCGDNIGSSSIEDGCTNINSETPSHAITPNKKSTKNVVQSPAVTP